MKNSVWIIIIALLGGISVFSALKYISAQRENYSLANDLGEMENQLNGLETQKQNLLQTIEKQKHEKELLDNDLMTDKAKLAKLEYGFTEAQKAIGDLNSQLNLLKEENIFLKNQGDTLKSELTQVRQEKDSLQVKLDSLDELKKAIRELKIKMRMARTATQEKLLAQQEINGNRGFVIKDGKSTYSAKIKIVVKPAPIN